MRRKFKGRKIISLLITFIVVLSTTINVHTKVWAAADTSSFVSRLYLNCLGRQADSGGLNYWVNELNSGSHTGASISEAFVFSNELNGRNVSDEEFLTIMYKSFYDRNPDDSGKNYWLDKLSKGITRKYVLSCFVNSQEFGGICDMYGIKRGAIVLSDTVDKYPNITAFTYRLYINCHERKPDYGGLKYWVDRLVSGYTTGADTAYAFVFSDELVGRNVSNDVFLNIMYRSFYDREPDTDGKNYWLNRMSNNATRKYVLANFVNSPEFNAVCSAYGINKGSIEMNNPIDKYPELVGFTNRFYLKTLNRPCDYDGLQYWVSRLTSGTTSAADMAISVIFSPEFTNKNLSNYDFVTIMYRVFLDREPDDAGLRYWSYLLNNGYSKRYIVASFVQSDEFKNICSQYSINQGNVTLSNGDVRDPEVNTRQSPAIIGETWVLGRGSDAYNYPATIEVTLLNLVSGDAAWNAVHAADTYNPAPASDEQYIVAKFRVQVDETSTSRPFQIDNMMFDVVSKDGNVYDRNKIGNVWGINSIEGSVYAGGVKEGWIALLVKKTDDPTLVFDRNMGSEVWFSLRGW